MNQTDIVQSGVITLTQQDILSFGVVFFGVVGMGIVILWVLSKQKQEKPKKATSKKKVAHKQIEPKKMPIPQKVSPQAFTLLKKNGVYTEIQHIQQEKPNVFSPIGIYNWFFHAKDFKRRLYVIMHKENGYMDLFYVYYYGNIFEYDNKIYIVDEDKLRWNDSLKTFVAEYYESISVPIQLQRYKVLMKQQLSDSLADSQVEMNINSKILYETVKTEMVQKVMKGEELEKFMNFIKRLLMFVLVGVIITVIAIVGRFV